jgi:hypothetical protein
MEPSMSGYETGAGPECGPYANELAELALGVSTGRERAEALAHVASCSSCQAEMERLSLAADSMLEAIGGVEPPLGFEVRLAERLRAGRSTRSLAGARWRYRRLSLIAACLLAVIALGAGAGAGWFVRGSGGARSSFGTAAGVDVSTRSLVANGRVLGYVTVYSNRATTGGEGRAGWLFMSLEVGSWSGEATCEIRLADGKDVSLGTFWLDGGYGAWAVSLAPGTGPIRTAWVATDKGILASADFTSDAPAAVPGASPYSGPTGI